MLFRFFAVRGCVEAERLTDETFDRAARKLDEGEKIEVKPEVYLRGVAKNVAHENNRDPEQHKKESLDSQADTLPVVLQQQPDIFPGQSVSSSETPVWQHEKAENCLKNCLGLLSFEDREILIEYYLPKKTGVKIGNRKKIAEHLNISRKALRNKVSRIKNRTRKCVTICVEPSQHG